MEDISSYIWEETSVLLFCFTLFISIYAIAFFFLFNGWKRSDRLEAASCSMSVIHGTLATVFTAYDILQSPWKLDAANTPYQQRVMEFSAAYFLADLLHYAFFVPVDMLFVLHHIATSTYILSCRYFTLHGAVSVMSLLGLAECTAPVQNLWTLTSLAPPQLTLATRVHNAVNPFFLTYFSIVRGILGPCLTFNLCKYYFAGRADSVIPRWLVYYWMSTVILAISGSLFWVSGPLGRLIASLRKHAGRGTKPIKVE